jgi:hypothetical protein
MTNREAGRLRFPPKTGKLMVCGELSLFGETGTTFNREITRYPIEKRRTTGVTESQTR